MLIVISKLVKVEIDKDDNNDRLVENTMIAARVNEACCDFADADAMLHGLDVAVPIRCV